jgi:4-amino-4-deoxy-L-arabinose transferase-like glycosyltransferase
VVLCLIVYVPGFFSIPPVDRDESRFAQASRQMFESGALAAARRDPRMHDGGLLIPKVLDRWRLNKPPLIYWMQAASAAVLSGGDPMRDAIWMYRVPSLLAAVAAVLLTWRIGASMFGPRAGVLAGAMLAVCPVVAWEAHQARADMMLLAWTTGAMGALWILWKDADTDRSERRSVARGRGSLGWALVLWVCVGAGVMTKGPITVLVVGLAGVALSVCTRDWRWVRRTRPLLGLVIAGAMVVPWVGLVAHRVGAWNYARTIYQETIGRSLSPREGHWAPPGYHVVLLPVLFWPGSLVTAAAVVGAFGSGFAGPAGGWRARLRSGVAGSPELFCLAWIVPAWIVFELVTTKLPHYTMPMYPAVAVLSARAAVGWVESAPLTRGTRVGVWVWGMIGGVPALGLAMFVALYLVLFATFAAEDRELAPIHFWMVVATVLAAAAVVMVWRGVGAASGGRMALGVRRGIVAMVLMLIVGLQGVAPLAAPGALTAAITPGITERPDWMSRPIASEYHEDSLIYGLRGHVERIEEGVGEPWLAAHPDGILIVRVHGADSARWGSDSGHRVLAVMPASLLVDAVPIYYVVERAGNNPP